MTSPYARKHRTDSYGVCIWCMTPSTEAGADHNEGCPYPAMLTAHAKLFS